MRTLTIIFVCALLTVSCKKQRDIVRDIPPRSAEKIISSMRDAGIPEVRYYSAKAEVDLQVGDLDRTIHSHIRSVKDSVLWVSVTPALGIEVARAVLSYDSVKVLERITDKYFTGTLTESEGKFGIPMDFQLLQQAFLGIPIALDFDAKYRSDRENGQYVLISKGPRKFVRVAESTEPLVGDTLHETDEEKALRRNERVRRRAQNRMSIVTKYWIDPVTMLTTRALIVDLGVGLQADVRYLEREEVNGMRLPKKLEVVVSNNEKEARVELELTRIRTTGPLNTTFRIPDKYEPMEP